MDCIKTVLFNVLDYINNLEEDEFYKRHSIPNDSNSYTESQFVELYRRSSKKKFGFLGAIVVFIIVVVVMCCLITACTSILKKKKLFKISNTVDTSNNGYSNNNNIQYNMNTPNINSLISSDDSNPYLNGQYAQSFQNSNTGTTELQQVPLSYQPQNYYQNPGYYSNPNNFQQGYYSYQNYPQQEFREADTDNTENNKTKETA